MSSIGSSKNAPQQTYERSKFEVEDFLAQFFKNTGSPVIIFRPPGVYGKWSRPNFNSVVATFCFNIANELPIQIHDPKTIVKLLYVDDLVTQIIASLGQNNRKIWYPKLKFIKEISLEKLAALINSFEMGRKKFICRKCRH